MQIAAESLKYNIASYLYEKAGDQINELSYLNGYVTSTFQPVVLEPVSYFGLSFLTSPVLKTMKYKYGNNQHLLNEINSNFVNSIGNLALSFTAYEDNRVDSLREIFLRQTILSHFLLALREGDTDSLKNIISKTPEIVDTVISRDLIEPNSSSKVRVYLTDMLIESIRYNQPGSVKFILEHMKGTSLNIGDIMNPLTSAIMTSFLIEYNSEKEREKSLEIINMLIDQKSKEIDLRTDSILNLKPIDLASIAGLVDVVKKLHEEHNIPLPIYENGILGTGVDHVDLAYSQGFKVLAQYYEQNIEGQEEADTSDELALKKCRETFH